MTKGQLLSAVKSNWFSFAVVPQMRGLFISVYTAFVPGAVETGAEAARVGRSGSQECL